MSYHDDILIHEKMKSRQSYVNVKKRYDAILLFNKKYESLLRKDIGKNIKRPHIIFFVML
jgi:rRNA pseudouridine-1189 N-methylase Emg1 (Nep1/Mra1 family)